ncbi:MAG: hypothetical protein H7A39_01315 [Chlamydiales bacterium]|nr:hypothetical protein [Chlamydiales bacterium]
MVRLLEALIKKKDFEWSKTIAQTAEHFSALNAQKSSAFQLALQENYIKELEERCGLYLQHIPGRDLGAFRKFFENQKIALRETLLSRFGIKVLETDVCKNVQDIHEAILSARPQQITKNPVGFGT